MILIVVRKLEPGEVGAESLWKKVASLLMDRLELAVRVVQVVVATPAAKAAREDAGGLTACSGQMKFHPQEALFSGTTRVTATEGRVVVRQTTKAWREAEVSAVARASAKTVFPPGGLAETSGKVLVVVDMEAVALASVLPTSCWLEAAERGEVCGLECLTVLRIYRLACPRETAGRPPMRLRTQPTAETVVMVR